jgi:hypothetical protein
MKQGLAWNVESAAEAPPANPFEGFRSSSAVKTEVMPDMQLLCRIQNLFSRFLIYYARACRITNRRMQMYADCILHIQEVCPCY